MTSLWKPSILIGSVLALSKIKYCVVNLNHSALSSTIIEVAFPRTQVYSTAKSSVFSILWTTVVRVSYQEGLPWTDFPTTPKIMVFDDIWRDSLCRSFQGFWQLVRQTRHWHERLTQLTHVSCHLFHDLWWKWLGKVSNFTGGNAVFLLRIRIFVFWLFLCIKFCVKPRRTLNGSQETFLGSFLWLDVSSNK